MKFALDSFIKGASLFSSDGHESDAENADAENADTVDVDESDAVPSDVDEDGFDLGGLDLDGPQRPPMVKIAIAAAGMLVLGIVVGGAWWIIGGGAEPGSTAEDGVPWVSVNIPPRSRSGVSSDVDARDTDSAGKNRMLAVPISEVPSIGSKAYAAIPAAQGEPLSPVPDAGLVEQGSHGPLPMIGADGRQPWKVYARPTAAAEDRPQVVIIMTGLGLSAVATAAAIDRLPPSVTLAFDPYGRELDDWTPLARQKGHEFLLSIPMEPVNFPVTDPGPYALESVLPPVENLRRLDFVLSRLSGYVGVLGGTKSFFTTEEEKIRPVLQVLKGRGLLFVDGGASPQSVAAGIAVQIKLPRVINDLIVDADPSAEAIDKQLARLEEISRKRTVAVGIARPYPSTVARLVAWAATLESKNMVLSPVSAVADVR